MSTLASGPTIRAGFAPALPLHLLLDLVRALRARVPGIAVHVTHLISLDQLKRLRSGELDLAIVVDPEEAPDLEIELLFSGELLVACLPAGHRLVGHQTVRPPDLFEETYVTGASSVNPGAYERALARFAAAGYRFRSVEQVDGVTARDLLFAVVSGRGFTLLPGSLEDLGDAGDDVVLRPLDPPLHMPPTAVAWRANAAPDVRPILETTRSVAHELLQALDSHESSRLPTVGSEAGPSTGTLTARQLDVLRLLADGKSTREIANDLRLSEATVRNHVAALIAALGVHTRLQAVIAARRAGLLDL